MTPTSAPKRLGGTKRQARQRAVEPAVDHLFRPTKAYFSSHLTFPGDIIQPLAIIGIMAHRHAAFAEKARNAGIGERRRRAIGQLKAETSRWRHARYRP